MSTACADVNERSAYRSILTANSANKQLKTVQENSVAPHSHLSYNVQHSIMCRTLCNGLQVIIQLTMVHMKSFSGAFEYTHDISCMCTLYRICMLLSKNLNIKGQGSIKLLQNSWSPQLSVYPCIPQCVGISCH